MSWLSNMRRMFKYKLRLQNLHSPSHLITANPDNHLLLSRPLTADVGNVLLQQAKEELVGQQSLFQQSKRLLGTLKRQNSGDR